VSFEGVPNPVIECPFHIVCNGAPIEAAVQEENSDVVRVLQGGQSGNGHLIHSATIFGFWMDAFSVYI
jgi:hypothetical protein